MTAEPESSTFNFPRVRALFPSTRLCTRAAYFAPRALLRFARKFVVGWATSAGREEGKGVEVEEAIGDVVEEGVAGDVVGVASRATLKCMWMVFGASEASFTFLGATR